MIGVKRDPCVVGERGKDSVEATISEENKSRNAHASSELGRVNSFSASKRGIHSVREIFGRESAQAPTWGYSRFCKKARQESVTLKLAGSALQNRSKGRGVTRRASTRGTNTARSAASKGVTAGPKGRDIKGFVDTERTAMNFYLDMGVQHLLGKGGGDYRAEVNAKITHPEETRGATAV